jgi:hypothetical protein
MNAPLIEQLASVLLDKWHRMLGIGSENMHSSSTVR